MWDYLILTASNAAQAQAYESQLAARRGAGLLRDVRQLLVVADLEDKRIGSGGSTLECLRVVANREGSMDGLRVLIVHAGGDSRRLPAYGPCGKIFVPIPGESASSLPLTLFDRLVPAFLALPAPAGSGGQIVVAAGDALLLFDAAGVQFGASGITMLGSPATVEEASRHGVFCLDAAGGVRLYLQKPSRAEQEAMGAIGADGHSILDIGVTNLDSTGAAALLDAFEVGSEWSAEMREMLLSHGIDLYREICCAMGTEATVEHYLRTARTAGSQWSDAALQALFPRLHAIPFHVRTLPAARFLHFGATRQLIASGAALLGTSPDACLLVNCVGDDVTGRASWVEGCRIAAPLTLGGRNAVIGLDIPQPLTLPERAAIDLSPGDGVTYVRCYGTDDSFKDATFCGRPMAEWLNAVEATVADVWEGGDRTLWSARVFPAEPNATDFTRWLWMYDPHSATAEQKREWRAATRFSAADIARLTDQDAFHRRRIAIHREAAC